MITKNKLSIIIPCYNCEKTLEESVNSIYTQNINIPFEIIMVDDGSTDGTYDLIKSLSKKYKEIKFFFNKKNKGGGATRNIAVKKSDGEIIFCLDSDDYLDEGSLGKMVNLWKEKKCDGVIYEKSIKFKRNNPKNVALLDIFDFDGKEIPIESFFGEKLCPLFTVFLFTRESFDIIEGYPENHGFDTQGFGFRFFLNDLKVYVCPDTVYWHRVGLPKSYYVREYEAGKANHNWYLLLEEFLYIFEDEIKEKILNWNLNSPYMENNMGFLVKTIKISSEKKKLLTHFSKDQYTERLKNKTTDNYDKYWLGTYLFHKKDYGNSKKIFEDLLKENFYANYIHIYLSKCVEETKTESEFLKPEEIDRVLKLSPQGKSARIIQKVLRRLIKIFKK